VTFFALSLLVYSGLVAWLSGRLGGTTAEWGYTLAHLALAAAINSHLLWVARRRELSFLGSAPLAFLVVHHFYFTVAGLKYFSPILLYPQFDLSLDAQFAGSVAGAVVLFVCALVLRREHGPTTSRVQAWVDRHWGDIRRVMIVSVIGSILCKVILVQLGYGSIYTESLYNEHMLRSYEDNFILLANDTFGVLSVTFGILYLFHRRMGPRRPLSFAFALLGVLVQVGYILLYLKGRMILLTTPITMAVVAEALSRRRAERALQGLLLVMPGLSLLGVQLTLLIGRFNVPEDAGMRLAIAAVNRRADLTDFPTAMMVSSHGEAHDARIISAAVLNAIPRAFFPGKEEVVHDVYSDILEQQLGWPAGAGEEMQADYLDTAFSNGVMSFGIAGFVVVPLALTWMFGWLCRWLDRHVRRLAYGFTIISLWLAAMHIEGEWASIPLNVRQAIFYGLISLGIAMIARMVHRMLALASVSPALLPAGSADPEAPGR
jgi:hypothetical protein